MYPVVSYGNGRPYGTVYSLGFGSAELSTVSVQLHSVFGCYGDYHIYSTVNRHIQDNPDVHTPEFPL